MRMAVTRKQVDGGILFIKRYTRGGLVPFKLQMIEVDELDTTASIPRHKGNTVVSGIDPVGGQRPNRTKRRPYPKGAAPHPSIRRARPVPFRGEPGDGGRMDGG